MDDRWWLGILAGVIVCLQGCRLAPLPRQQDVVLTLVSETWNSDLRARRAASSTLPDRLAVSLPVLGHLTLLRLTRSRLLPVVMGDEQSTRGASTLPEKAAVYTDVAMKAAMIVRREADNYTLSGSFVHDGVPWRLQNRLDRRDTEPRHLLSRHVISETISYVGDEVMFTRESTQDHDTTWDNETQSGQQDTSWDNETQSRQQDTRQERFKGHSLRTKRAPTRHVVKVAFVVDFADYSKWVKYVGLEAAPGEMRLWYTHVADSVKVRYRTIQDPRISIKVIVTTLRILHTAKDASFLTPIINRDGKLDGEKALSAFVTWHKTQPGLAKTDHYMLFTGLDIAEISGIAYVARLCTDQAVSVVENTFDGNTGNTAAHELGHSLSAKHDNEDTSQGWNCSYDNQYIMAAAFKKPVTVDNEGHPWRFSACSVAAFKTFLAGATCTRRKTSSKLALQAWVRPGQAMSKDDQCRQYFRNPSSYYCKTTQELEGGVERLCGGMLCSVPHSETDCQVVIPEELTSCGSNKWCVAGRCVGALDNTPATTTTPSIKTTEVPTTASTTTTTTVMATVRTSVQTATSSVITENTSGLPVAGSSSGLPVAGSSSGLPVAGSSSGLPVAGSSSTDSVPVATVATRISFPECYIYLLLGHEPAFHYCQQLMRYGF